MSPPIPSRTASLKKSVSFDDNVKVVQLYPETSDSEDEYDEPMVPIPPARLGAPYLFSGSKLPQLIYIKFSVRL